MVNVVRPRLWKKHDEALVISAITTLLVFLLVVFLTYRVYTDTVELQPGFAWTMELRGNEFQTVSISVRSSSLLTLCITDDVGVKLLYSGKTAPCYLYLPEVKETSVLWRFPSSRTYYLVVMSESHARARIKIVMGVAAVWGGAGTGI